MSLNRIYTIIFFLLSGNFAFAQPDITGTWEGDLSNREFIQINIIQVDNDKVCGYTWDHMYSDRRDHCKAYFTGKYDAGRAEWVLSGKSFMENSGNHVLMIIKMRLRYDDNGKQILVGTVGTKSFLGVILGASDLDVIRLEKTSKKPTMVTQQMRDCEEEKKKLEEPVVTKTDTTVRVKTPAITVTVPKIKDSIGRAAPRETVLVNPRDSASIDNNMTVRTNKEMTRVIVNDKNIRLDIYDNALEDGDTVSLFYDGKLLVSHQLLSIKPITIEIILDETGAEHKLVLFAENLGSIPPNTALIVVTAGNKRYELFASASLQENAVLISQYKPPGN